MKQPLFMVLVLALISLGNAGIAISAARLSPMNISRRLALRRGSAGWGTLILLAVGTLGAGFAAISLVQLIGIKANQGASQILSDMVKNSSPGEFAMLVIVISVFPAVCEELLFRGYAMTRLIDRWGSVMGIAISGLMFGLIHLDPVQTPAMILLGSYLGWTAYRTGSTRTSILCHLVNNAVAVALPLLDSKSDDTNPTLTQLLSMLGIGLAACGVCTWFANWAMKKKAQMDFGRAGSLSS
jgi:membrane protease YdiL (CAAX protease family)